MTSSNGNIFGVTGPMCGVFTGKFLSQRPVTRALMFYFSCAWINDWVKNREAGDFRRHRAHYDVTVMSLYWAYWPLTDPIIARCPAIDPNFPSQSIVWCVAHLSRVSAYELSHIRSIVWQGAHYFSIHEDIIAWINHDIVMQVINCLFI